MYSLSTSLIFSFVHSSVRPSRAYKVAGLTLLACILIVGQATIAYFLISQQGDIKSLKVQNENLNSKLSNGRSGEENLKKRYSAECIITFIMS